MSDEVEEPDEVDRDIGLRLRAARTISALTLEQLGAAVQISGQQLSKYELGVNRISASALFRIARALCLSINDLLPAISADDDILSSEDLRTVRALRGLSPAVRAELLGLIQSIGSSLDQGRLSGT